MTTTMDPRTRLQQATSKENVESSKLMNDIPPWEREKYPLARFRGAFTGETREIPETTRNGNTFMHFALVYKVVEVFQKLDSQFQVGDTYNVIADGPPPGKEDKVANYALGMMAEDAFANGVNIWDEGVVVDLILTGKKPWPKADRATYYYKVSKVEGASAAPAAIDPAAEAFAVSFASGLTDSEFFSGVLPALAQAGHTDNALQTEIASRRFLPRMVSEGRLLFDLDNKVYALPA